MLEDYRKGKIFLFKQIEKLVVNVTRTKWHSPESEGMQLGNCRCMSIIKKSNCARELMHG